MNSTTRIPSPLRRRRTGPRLGTIPTTMTKGLRFAGAYVDPETHEKLEALAKSEHRTVASLCRVIFDAAIEGRIQQKG